MDKIAYITGGSKGIGLGIAEAMLKEDMKVAITGRNKQDLDKAEDYLSRWGTGDVMGIVSDVRNLEAEQQAIDKVLTQWGKIRCMYR